MHRISRSAAYLIAIPLMAATPVSTRPDLSTAKTENSGNRRFGGSKTPTVRDIEYMSGEVVSVSNRLRYNTTIVLPEGEAIADVVCGDGGAKDSDGRWVINAARDTGFAYVKPTAIGAETNLTLVTKSGHSYLFLLHETRKTPPDLRVSLKIPVKPNVGPPVKMVPESEANKAKQDAEDSRAELASLRSEYESDRESWQKKAAEAVARAKADAPGSLRFDYKWSKKKEFHVEAIAHDGARTYIWADPSQAVALYGRFEGKPDLIQFSYSHGLYTADKVLEDGYLQIGKSRLKFRMWD